MGIQKDFIFANILCPNGYHRLAEFHYIGGTKIYGTIASYFDEASYLLDATNIVKKTGFNVDFNPDSDVKIVDQIYTGLINKDPTWQGSQLIPENKNQPPPPPPGP